METKIAVVKSTGLRVNVYRLKSGDWCNYDDCKTIYKENELSFIRNY